MPSYVGPLGSLVELRSPARIGRGVARAGSERTTLGGVRKAQLGARAQRSLSVSHSFLSPADIGNLAALVAGEYGPGPFWWVDPWAQVTNLLTPEASTLGEGTWAVTGTAVAGGSAPLAGGGIAGRTVLPGLSTDTVFVPRRATARDDVPVMPGRAVTGSVYASGASVTVRVQFVDLMGDPVSSVSSVTAAPGSALTRCSVTATPPAGAVACYVAVLGALRIARPAITWTGAVKAWHVGQGFPRGLITGLSADVIAAWESMQGETMSYTVTEVG